MIHIDIRHNLADSAGDLARMSRQLQTLAVTRALNKTAARAKTKAGREIKEQYRIGTRLVSRFISISRAGGRKGHIATVSAEGRPMPMIAFKPRQTASGVSVDIKGRRVTVPHAFIATMRSGHRGVFARGGYKGSFERAGGQFGSFIFGRQRLPLGELFTFSLPQAFSSKVVLDRVTRHVNNEFPKVLRQEINFIFSRNATSTAG